MTTAVSSGLTPELRKQDQAERPFHLSESKLHPPVARPGMVARTVVLDRLIGVRASAVISVVAPAGYGKTTLLAQWAESKQPRLAWLSADHGDNDPTVLLKPRRYPCTASLGSPHAATPSHASTNWVCSPTTKAVTSRPGGKAARLWRNWPTILQRPTIPPR